MNKEIEQVTKVTELVDKYAQSRAMGLLIPMVVYVINVVVLIGAIELLGKLHLKMFWFNIFIALVLIWVLGTSIGVCFWANKYGHTFYKKDGAIKLKQKPIHWVAWVLYIIGFLGGAILSQSQIVSIRIGLFASLISFGIFILYASRMEKEKYTGVVFGWLCISLAVLTLLGIPWPFRGENWVYSYFAASVIYIVGSSILTVIFVHLYNRFILKKIKQTQIAENIESQENVSES